MKRALIISKTEKGLDAISKLVKAEGYDDIHCTTSVTEAEAYISQTDFDLILISAPLAEENGLSFSVRCADKTKSCVLLIVAKDKAMDAFDLVDSHGVLVVSRPINKRLLHNYIVFSHGFKERLLPIQRENERLRSEIEEIKVINRAKLLLVQCLTMSEQQAHRYIEKQAMNLRTSKLNIAKQVIKTYEN